MKILSKTVSNSALYTSTYNMNGATKCVSLAHDCPLREQDTLRDRLLRLASSLEGSVREVWKVKEIELVCVGL